ncbi:MAG: hypothetical protein E7317_05780 [Clostridiales bacterium]|nr:hypothetical protein [Clostridiales bacterium]
MKKLFSLLLVLMLVFSSLPVVAEVVEEVEGVEEAEAGTKFEKVLLKKGGLIIKEFVDCCFFEKDDYFGDKDLGGFSDTLQFQSASLTDVETGTKVYALRITCGYYNSQYDNGETVGVMDADEIDGAISTLEYIKSHINETVDYTEIIYTTNGGIQIGAYKSDTGTQLFVKVSSKATKFYGIDTIDSLIDALNQVKATFG